MKPFHRWVLPNGLTVLYRQSEGVPLAAATLLLRTGSVYETPPQAGLANLTMEVSAARTRHRSSRNWRKRSIHGASLGAQAAVTIRKSGLLRRRAIGRHPRNIFLM